MKIFAPANGDEENEKKVCSFIEEDAENVQQISFITLLLSLISVVLALVV
jgi:hypothetical protein